MVLYATQPKTLNPADPYNKVSTCAQRPTASNRSAVLPSSSTGIICGVRIRRLAGAHRTRLTSANRRRRHWPPDAMPSRYCEFVDSRLRRSPPDRASAVPYGQAGENAARFPQLAHRSAGAHKLHSTPQQHALNLISGKGETSSRLPGPFSLFLPGSCPNNRNRCSLISYQSRPFESRVFLLIRPVVDQFQCKTSLLARQIYQLGMCVGLL